MQVDIASIDTLPAQEVRDLAKNLAASLRITRRELVVALDQNKVLQRNAELLQRELTPLKEREARRLAKLEAYARDARLDWSRRFKLGPGLEPDMPVSALRLSCRPAHCLKNEGCETIGDILAHTEEELLRMPNFGRVSLRELKQALAGEHPEDRV